MFWSNGCIPASGSLRFLIGGDAPGKKQSQLSGAGGAPLTSAVTSRPAVGGGSSPASSARGLLSAGSPPYDTQQRPGSESEAQGPPSRARRLDLDTSTAASDVSALPYKASRRKKNVPLRARRVRARRLRFTGLVRPGRVGRQERGPPGGQGDGGGSAADAGSARDRGHEQTAAGRTAKQLVWIRSTSDRGLPADNCRRRLPEGGTADCRRPGHGALSPARHCT